MKNLFLTGFLLIFAFGITECSIANMLVELGKEVKNDFGKGMTVIKRTTDASPDPQYLFASPNQDGSWTTDGKNKIPSTAHLYWNGTLVFKKIAKTDIGSYEMPLEPSRCSPTKNGGMQCVGQTMFNFLLQGSI